MNINSFPFSWTQRLLDAACIFSLFGIWPRYIEPKLLHIARHTIAVDNLPRALHKLKIVHLSDLHINGYTSSSFLKKVQKKVLSLRPDLIVFTGDFLTYSSLSYPELAADFLSKFSAPLGVFACLGNHDYAQYATYDGKGRISYGQPDCHPVMQGLKKICGTSEKKQIDPSSLPLSPNKELLNLYRSCNITLLHNRTVHIGLNLTGLGDPMTGNFDPSTAFKGWDQRTPGIVIAHNPNIYQYLSPYPGNLFLFGHTHGGQVNLPFIGKRLLGINHSLKSGLYIDADRHIFVSRGIGSTYPFRLFAPPDIGYFELVPSSRVTQEAKPTQFFTPREIILPTPQTFSHEEPLL